MQAWWIIPNRDQRDDILASDGQIIRPLKELLDPRLRPAGFSHGVPNELLRRCEPEARGEILFAQKFPHWNQNRELFIVSSPAGADNSGRVVHLGLLSILERHERPKFDLACAALSAEDRAYARILIDRLTSPARGDLWAQSVHELAEMPAASGPATNVVLHHSVQRFHSLYEAGPNGLIRKSKFGRKSRRGAGSGGLLCGLN